MTGELYDYYVDKLRDDVWFELDAIWAAIDKLRLAVDTLISDPGNPHSAAGRASKVLNG